MANKSSSEYPKASEKLSYKFILDTLKDNMLWKENPEASAIETAPTTVELDAKEEPPVQEEIPVEQCGSEIPVEEIPVEIEAPIENASPIKELKLEPGKKYFRIGEVSELIGVEAYVLRYWESEFSLVRPTKSSSGHRVYSRRDVETLHQIRHLLHVEKFSIKGAKKKLLEKKKETKEVVQKLEPNYKLLKELAHDLKELIALAKA